MHTFFKGQILGKRQRRSRRDQAFNGGRVGQTQENGRVCEHARLFQRIDEKTGDIELDAHRGKNNREFFLSGQNPSLAGNLCGNPIMRHAASREDGKLLPPNERVHAVDRGNAGLDKFVGIVAGGRIDRLTVDINRLAGNQFRPAVLRLAHSVKNTAENVR